MSGNSAPKIIDIDGIQVLFERSKRARRISISVRNSGEIRVAVPKRASWEAAERFARSKCTWVRKQLTKLQKRNQQSPLNSMNDSPPDREYAREVLTNRLKELAGSNGFSYNRVSIRYQKTLWGSCSAKNNISLNARLVLLPDDVRDYVLMHELIHTRIKGHGPRFWKEFEKHMPGCRVLKKRLREIPLCT
jgi:predicted metal-dependent hydrolase